jgi:hypothetical protein
LHPFGLLDYWIFLKSIFVYICSAQTIVTYLHSIFWIFLSYFLCVSLSQSLSVTCSCLYFCKKYLNQFTNREYWICRH